MAHLQKEYNTDRSPLDILFLGTTKDTMPVILPGVNDTIDLETNLTQFVPVIKQIADPDEKNDKNNQITAAAKQVDWSSIEGLRAPWGLKRFFADRGVPSFGDPTLATTTTTTTTTTETQDSQLDIEPDNYEDEWSTAIRNKFIHPPQSTTAATTTTSSEKGTIMDIASSCMSFLDPSKQNARALIVWNDTHWGDGSLDHQLFLGLLAAAFLTAPANERILILLNDAHLRHLKITVENIFDQLFPATFPPGEGIGFAYVSAHSWVKQNGVWLCDTRGDPNLDRLNESDREEIRIQLKRAFLEKIEFSAYSEAEKYTHRPATSDYFGTILLWDIHTLLSSLSASETTTAANGQRRLYHWLLSAGAHTFSSENLDRPSLRSGRSPEAKRPRILAPVWRLSDRGDLKTMAFWTNLMHGPVIQWSFPCPPQKENDSIANIVRNVADSQNPPLLQNVHISYHLETKTLRFASMYSSSSNLHMDTLRRVLTLAGIPIIEKETQKEFISVAPEKEDFSYEELKLTTQKLFCRLSSSSETFKPRSYAISWREKCTHARTNLPLTDYQSQYLEQGKSLAGNFAYPELPPELLRSFPDQDPYKVRIGGDEHGQSEGNRFFLQLHDHLDKRKHEIFTTELLKSIYSPKIAAILEKIESHVFLEQNSTHNNNHFIVCRERAFGGIAAIEMAMDTSLDIAPVKFRRGKGKDQDDFQQWTIDTAGDNIEKNNLAKYRYLRISETESREEISIALMLLRKEWKQRLPQAMQSQLENDPRLNLQMESIRVILATPYALRVAMHMNLSLSKDTVSHVHLLDPLDAVELQRIEHILTTFPESNPADSPKWSIYVATRPPRKTETQDSIHAQMETRIHDEIHMDSLLEQCQKIDELHKHIQFL